MSTMREAWTDERLDDLKDGMHREFGQVHADDRDLRTEIRAVRTELKADIQETRTELKAEIQALRSHTDTRFDALYRNLIVGYASIIATIVGAVVVHAL
jgi:hypothetical protein